MATERFSKRALASHLVGRIDSFDFDGRDGWNQVKGRGEDRNREYGEYDAYRRIMDAFDLWDVKLDEEQRSLNP